MFVTEPHIANNPAHYVAPPPCPHLPSNPDSLSPTPTLPLSSSPSSDNKLTSWKNNTSAPWEKTSSLAYPQRALVGEVGKGDGLEGRYGRGTPQPRDNCRSSTPIQRFCTGWGGEGVLHGRTMGVFNPREYHGL